MKRKTSLTAILRPNRDKRSVPYENYADWVISRILSRSIKRENGCIEYGGGNLKHKYGLISITLFGYRMIAPAHRAMYMATYGLFDLPKEIHVRHKCDNPCCVNIDHLEPGTAKENRHDCIDRGRDGLKGKRRPLQTRLVKLTDEQVRDIKSCRHSPQWYADEYGITKNYAYRLQAGMGKPLIS